MTEPETTDPSGRAVEAPSSPAAAAPPDRESSEAGHGRTGWRRITSSLRTRVLLWYVVLLAVALALSIWWSASCCASLSRSASTRP